MTMNNTKKEISKMNLLYQINKLDLKISAVERNILEHNNVSKELIYELAQIIHLGFDRNDKNYIKNEVRIKAIEDILVYIKSKINECANNSKVKAINSRVNVLESKVQKLETKR